MGALSHPWLLAFGAMLIGIGFLLWRWAGRHDLKGLAVDAAWQVARNRGNLAAAADSDIGQKLKELQADGSATDKARKVAGYAARHFLAQAASVAGIVAVLGGLALIALAFWLGR